MNAPEKVAYPGAERVEKFACLDAERVESRTHRC